MGRSAEFVIENDCNSDISVWVEPEAFPVALSPGEEIVVLDEAQKHPVTIRVWRDDSGAPALSIWPGDGETVVKKDERDVLDPPNV